MLKDESDSRPVAKEPDPRVRINWKVVGDAVGPEVHAVVEETAGILVSWPRDVVIGKVPV